MMFKHLGRFGVLAVCLFALAMVGCGPDEEETPMEKLAGTYTLIDREIVSRGSVLPREDLSGHLHLMPEGNGWSRTIGGDSDSGPTWSATDTTITKVPDSGEESWTEDYTLVGTVLTLVYEDENLHIEHRWEKD